MIPTIFYNRECQKCSAYGTIVRSTLELVEKKTGKIQITSRCPDNTNCTKEHKSILQEEQIEYFLYLDYQYVGIGLPTHSIHLCPKTYSISG